MSNEERKVSKNRLKKEGIVANLDEKLAKSVAIIFTNYTGLTHKQLEGLKKAIKPLKAEFVVAKNSLILRAMEARKIKLENNEDLAGQTGTLFIYEDLVSPLKELAKLIKNYGIPSVKFGIIEGNKVTGEDVLRLSSLPTKDVLLSQLAATLKSPIYGLHRALSWNIQKLVMTLGAVARLPRPESSDGGQEKSKPADVAPVQPASEPASAEPIAKQANEPEPETILEETSGEKKLEKPQKPTEEANEEVKIEGGEN